MSRKPLKHVPAISKIVHSHQSPLTDKDSQVAGSQRCVSHCIFSLSFSHWSEIISLETMSPDRFMPLELWSLNSFACGGTHGLHVPGLATAATLVLDVTCSRYGSCTEHVEGTIDRICHADTCWCYRSCWSIPFFGKGTEAVVTRCSCWWKRP